MKNAAKNITIVNVHFCTLAKMTQRKKINAFVVNSRVLHGYFYIIDGVYFVADDVGNGL